MVFAVFFSFLILATAAPEHLTVHYLDVGQGDATLLMVPGCTVLIDAGRHDRDNLLPLLQERGVESLDILAGTHPHADHIGQFPQVLEAFPVEEVWMSGDEHTTLTFERALDAVLDSDAGFREPRASETHTCGDLVLEILNPDELTGDFHEGSLSIRAVYGKVAFIFTGDAERVTELAMVERGHDLSALVLQLGHHGSRTSTHPDFLEAVGPEIAIYSAEAESRYGHPHPEVVELLEERGVEIYGTPVHGTIRVVTDGDRYRVFTEREGLAGGAPPDPEHGDGDAGAPPGRIDLNTASLEELVTIIHIGEARAKALKELRPFSSVEDLRRVPGLGPARINDIREEGIAHVRE